MSTWVRAFTMLGAMIAGLAGAAVAQDDDIGWPREMRVAGATIVIYQPQLEAFEGDSLTGRAAVSVTMDGQTEPTFGAFWFAAFLQTDRETRTANIVEFHVPRVRFPEVTEDQQNQLKGILELEVPSWDMTISLDRIQTGIELAQHEHAASENLATAPPTILFTTEPSILVLLEGDPVMHDVENTDMQRVVNTPFAIIHDPATSAYYLYAGQETWFSATDVMGPWALSSNTPEKVASLVPPDTAQAELAEEDTATFEIENLVVVVATEPTELIISNGPPQYASVDGTDLLYINNTESDVFREIDTQKFYIVLAGRWYSAGTLDGPWIFVPSDSLPGDFAMIPPESARGSVLPYVAGTDEAMDAVLDHSIPQTSAIHRDGTLEVTYDGDPQFEVIEGTEMRYAVNTESQVLEIGGVYYVCDEAVWYMSNNPTGPYTVTVEVPDDVQDIPPENPNYNVKYVYVYDYTPEIVYVGYTPGYTWSYSYGPTVVYGTGYYYHPWVSPYYYYPRPVTWGFHIRYNPWYGWSFGFGVGYGAFHFGFYSGPSYWRRGWWGPGGYRHGYHRGYHRGYGQGYRRGYRAGYAAGQRNSNVYNRQRNAARNVDRGTARSQMSQRQRSGGAARTQAGQRPATSQPQRAQGRDNNVFTDNSGNVYRRNQDGSWQMRDNQNWNQADRSRVEGGGQGGDRSRDAARQQPSTRQSTTNRSGNLSREDQNRQRGAQRTQSYSRSRSRGGGRRR